MAEAATGRCRRSVVVIYLNGGNDGLNSVVPTYGTSRVRRLPGHARPNIARILGPERGGQVGCTPMLGLGAPARQPDAVGRGRLGRRRQRQTRSASTRSAATARAAPGSDLALFPSVQYPNASRSHFDSRDYWFAGAP